MTDKTNGLGRQGVAVVRLFLGLLPLLAVCVAWTAAVFAFRWQERPMACQTQTSE